MFSWTSVSSLAPRWQQLQVETGVETAWFQQLTVKCDANSFRVLVSNIALLTHSWQSDSLTPQPHQLQFCSSKTSIKRGAHSLPRRITGERMGRLTERNSTQATRVVWFDSRFRPSQPHSQRRKATTRRHDVFTFATFNASCTLWPPANQRTARRRARHTSPRFTRRATAAAGKEYPRAETGLARYVAVRTTTRYLPRRRARRLSERGPYYATTEAAASGHLHVHVIIFI